MMNQAQVVTLIEKRMEGKSLRKLADEMGISAPYLSDVLHGNREPGEKILSFLGLEKQVSRTVKFIRRKK